MKYARQVHVLVHFANILREMFANGREFTAADAGHSELVDFAESSQIEACQADDLNVVGEDVYFREKELTPIC